MSSCEKDLSIIGFYIESVIYALAAISMLPFMRIYLRRDIRKNLKQGVKILYYLSLTMFIPEFILFILGSIAFAIHCNNVVFAYILYSIMNIISAIQSLLLVIVLFMRLYQTFKSTLYSLSMFTIKLFIGICITMTFLGIIVLSVYTYNIDNTLIASVLGIILLLYIFLLIWVVGLYVKKLIEVQRNASQNDEEFVKMITKTALLCIISVSTTLVLMISIVVLSLFDTEIGFLVQCLIILMDIYTNFMCILLSFNPFEIFYQRLCGFCHKKCYGFWSNWVESKDQKMIVTTVEANNIQNVDA